MLDGSAVSANLGVNPSLTITAQAELAMSAWPAAGEPDRRPTQAELLAGGAVKAPRRGRSATTGTPVRVAG